MAAAALFLAATASSPAWGASSDPVPAKIDKNGVLILLRTTLVALQQADETGNYTVLRDLSAPGFQARNDPARLAEVFRTLRERRIDLSGVTVLDPQLTTLPQVESNGMMRIAGFFPSVPEQVRFEVLYAPVNGRWRPFGLSVALDPAVPVAPGGQAPSPTPAPVPPKGPDTRPPPQQATRPARPAQAAAKPARRRVPGRDPEVAGRRPPAPVPGAGAAPAVAEPTGVY